MTSPTLAAAHKLRIAEEAVAEALGFLNYYRTETLTRTMLYLRGVAKALESGDKDGALELSLIDRAEAGRIMGRSKSAPKLDAASKARAALAVKRQQTALMKQLRGR